MRVRQDPKYLHSSLRPDTIFTISMKRKCIGFDCSGRGGVCPRYQVKLVEVENPQNDGWFCGYRFKKIGQENYGVEDD